MIRVLLVGLGEVGRKHLAVLRTLPEARVCGVVEPVEFQVRDVQGYRVPWFADHQAALRETGPDVVTVATPPRSGVPIAWEALESGAHVLVEKPVALYPDELDVLDRHPRSDRISVAFQTHLAPGVPELLAADHGSSLSQAAVRLRCRRDRPYYVGWRARLGIAGGVLHQQAIHGLALALRLWAPDDPVAQVHARVVNRRPWKEPEDHVWAHVTFGSGGELTLDARVDDPQHVRHTVELRFPGSGNVTIAGRNLEGGVLRRDQLAIRSHVTHAALRQQLYREVFARTRGQPCRALCSIQQLRRTLEVITSVYAAVPAAADAAVCTTELAAV